MQVCDCRHSCSKAFLPHHQNHKPGFLLQSYALHFSLTRFPSPLLFTDGDQDKDDDDDEPQ